MIQSLMIQSLMMQRQSLMFQSKYYHRPNYSYSSRPGPGQNHKYSMGLISRLKQYVTGLQREQRFRKRVNILLVV